MALIVSHRVCATLLRERRVLSETFMSDLQRENQGGEKVRCWFRVTQGGSEKR